MVLIQNSKKEAIDAVNRFPSPCGDYGSYHQLNLRRYNYEKI